MHAHANSSSQTSVIESLMWRCDSVVTQLHHRLFHHSLCCVETGIQNIIRLFMRAARQTASLLHKTRGHPPGYTFFCACRHRLDRCSLSAQRRVHFWLSRIYSISPHCLHLAGRHIPGCLPPPQAAHRHPHQHWLTHAHEHTVSRDELTPGGGDAAAEPLGGEGPPQEGLDPAGVRPGGGGGVYSRYIDSCPTGSGSGAASTRAGGIRSCGELVFSQNFISR